MGTLIDILGLAGFVGVCAIISGEFSPREAHAGKPTHYLVAAGEPITNAVMSTSGHGDNFKGVLGVALKNRGLIDYCVATTKSQEQMVKAALWINAEKDDGDNGGHMTLYNDSRRLRKGPCEFNRICVNRKCVSLKK